MRKKNTGGRTAGTSCVCLLISGATKTTPDGASPAESFCPFWRMSLLRLVGCPDTPQIAEAEGPWIMSKVDEELEPSIADNRAKLVMR